MVAPKDRGRLLEEEEVAELLMRLQPRLYAIARTYHHLTEEDAEDALQRTYLDLTRTLGTEKGIRERGSRWYVEKSYRNELNRLSRETSKRADHIPASLPAETSLPEERRTPLERLVEREELQRERVAVNLVASRLPSIYASLRERNPTAWQALQLCEVVGRSYKDIGKEIGKNENNVKMIIHRARKFVYNRLSKLFRIDLLR